MGNGWVVGGDVCFLNCEQDHNNRLVLRYKQQRVPQMQGYLKQIQSFLLSPQNIFTSTPLDYPTSWQQQLILSYFSIQQTLHKPHPQIIRELSSQSAQTLLTTAQGMLYLLLQDKNNMERLGQYMMILRIDVWGVIGEQFMVLLADYGEQVKGGYLGNCGVVLDGLMGYSLWEPYMVVLVAGFLGLWDIDMQPVIRAILHLFIEKMEEGVEFTAEIATTICRYLLPKVIKIAPFIQQPSCLKLLTLLLSKYPQSLQLPQQLLYILQSSPAYLKLPQLFQLHKKLKQPPPPPPPTTTTTTTTTTPPTALSLRQHEQIIFSYLPRKVQKVLQFIFGQGLKGNQLVYHLNWLDKYYGARRWNFGELLVDGARWVALNSDFMEQRLIILDWLCKRAANTNAQIWQRTKRAIFSNWFSQHTPQSLPTTITPIILLRHFLSTENRLCLQLLKTLLKSSLSHRGHIQAIFQQALESNHFKLEFITNSRFIPESIQQEFVSIVRVQSRKEEMGMGDGIGLGGVQGALQFNPGDSPVKSDQGEGPDYEGDSQERMEASHIVTGDVFWLEVEEAYVGEFTKLYDMVDDPTFQNFVQFFKQFLQIGQTARTQNRESLPTLFQQTSKILYCTFNNEFQSLPPITSSTPSQSIIHYIISYLLRSWHQVTHRVVLVKGMVKKMFQLFPVAQVAFWFVFFGCWDYGAANTRDFRSWLVAKEKGDLVVKAVEAVSGRIDDNFRKKVAKYYPR